MDIIALALACYRTPLAYQERLALAAPLPDDMDCLLKLANGVQDVLEAAVLQTGAKPQELRKAARFCIQQWCLARGASHYRVLGLEPGAPLAQLREHHRLLMRLLHPDRAAGRETWTENYAARVNAAWTALSRISEGIAAEPEPLLGLGDSGGADVKFALPPTVSTNPQPLRIPRRWRRRSWSLPRRWLPGMVLGGSALTATLGLGGWYLHQHGSSLTPPPDVPKHSTPIAQSDAPMESSPSAERLSALDAFNAAPNWQALAQREAQARQQAQQLQETRQHLEQSQRDQVAAEAAQLEQIRQEKAALEAQLHAAQQQMQQAQSERKAAERQRLDALQAAQAQLQRTQTERQMAERARLEALRAEQAKAERLAETLKAERQRLEQARAEQAAKTERLAETLKAERQRWEQAKAEQPAKVELAAKAAELPARVETAKTAPVPIKPVALPPPKPAAAHPPELPPTAAPAERTLTARDLANLIGRYTRAYEREDLADVMALFAANAGNARTRIRQDYTALFATHQVRQLRVQNLRWTQQEQTARGSGDYHVLLQRRDTGESVQAHGSIQFTVRKQEEQTVIEAIDYDWSDRTRP